MNGGARHRSSNPDSCARIATCTRLLIPSSTSSRDTCVFTVGLGHAVTAAGLSFEVQSGGAFEVDATVEQVGRAAAAAGQVLVELRDGEAGLEDLSFSLTSNPAALPFADRVPWCGVRR